MSIVGLCTVEALSAEAFLLLGAALRQWWMVMVDKYPSYLTLIWNSLEMYSFSLGPCPRDLALAAHGGNWFDRMDFPSLAHLPSRTVYPGTTSQMNTCTQIVSVCILEKLKLRDILINFMEEKVKIAIKICDRMATEDVSLQSFVGGVY